MRIEAKRYIPEGARKIAVKGAPCEIYLYELGGRLCAVGYYGKGSKPWYGPYSYRSEAARAERVGLQIKATIAAAKAHAERKAECLAARNAPNKLQVGHILVCSWGYEQTNVDFYKVLAAKGQYVDIAKIGSNDMSHGQSGAYSGKAIPALDGPQGEPMRKKVSYGDCVKIASYASARLWEGKPVAWTAYA